MIDKELLLCVRLSLALKLVGIKLCILILFISLIELFKLKVGLFWTIFGPRKLFPIKLISCVWLLWCLIGSFSPNSQLLLWFNILLFWLVLSYTLLRKYFSFLFIKLVKLDTPLFLSLILLYFNGLLIALLLL